MKRDKKKNKAEPRQAGPGQPIARDRVVPLVWELAEPLCRAESLELIHVEYQREPGGWVLRLFIGKPGGVTIDDCADVSHQLNDLLDIKLGADFPYTLEVSSPGPERPLSRFSDFDRFAGQTAKIRTRGDRGGQKNFTGRLLGVMGDSVLHTIDRETVAIPYTEITKARLVNYNGDDPC
ncbi:MAG: ribosome maturation factor RimP [Thermodesulfobacteriota bacterium]